MEFFGDFRRGQTLRYAVKDSQFAAGKQTLKTSFFHIIICGDNKVPDFASFIHHPKG